MYGLGVPSKVYNSMSAGLPILYVGDEGSEIDRYIKNYNIGWSFNWSQIESLKEFLNNLSLDDYKYIKEKEIILMS